MDQTKIRSLGISMDLETKSELNNSKKTHCETKETFEQINIVVKITSVREGRDLRLAAAIQKHRFEHIHVNILLV